MGENLDILNIIMQSGPVVKLVLLLLILASVVSWMIIFKKKSAFKEIENENQQFLDHFSQAASMKELYTQVEGFGNSTLSRVFKQGFTELDKIQSQLSGDKGKKDELKKHFLDFGFESINRAMKKGVNESNLELEKYNSILASIGSITPFVGLFGTVWGIINSFTGLASGGGTLDAVAPGIAEALVATAVGLAAAIPAVWFFNSFSNKNVEFNNEMESFEQDFLNIIERSVI